MKFQISFRSLQIDWQLCYQIAKFVANFGRTKQILESNRQKLFESHCNTGFILKQGGYDFTVVLYKKLPEDLSSGTAEFEGVGTVEVQKSSHFSLSGTVPCK